MIAMLGFERRYSQASGVSLVLQSAGLVHIASSTDATLKPVIAAWLSASKEFFVTTSDSRSAVIIDNFLQITVRSQIVVFTTELAQEQVFIGGHAVANFGKYVW